MAIQQQFNSNSTAIQQTPLLNRPIQPISRVSAIQQPIQQQFNTMPPRRRPAGLRPWLKLWLQYSEFRRPQVSPSTYQRDYRKFEVRLRAVKKAAPTLNTATEILNWMNSHYSSETTRRTMQQLNACGKWAVDQGLVRENPWAGLQTQIRKPPPGRDAWAAFTAAERDLIITQFEADHPHLLPWVKFQFFTGARPEETAALTWGNVAQDNSWMLFNQARPVDTGIIQRTKNYRETRFPCNPRLAQLIASQRQTADPSVPWVLPGLRGGPFDYKNFQERYWKPVVNQLVAQGLVACYLSQYHTRHTWITLALDHLPPQDVAYLARTSVDVIYKHYVGRNRKIEIPEF